MSGPEKFVLLGKVVGVHGIRGELKLESYTEPRTQIFRYQPWRLRSASGETTIAGSRGRAQGKGIVATLPGVDDRDAAAALIGSEIWVARSALPKSAPGEYYWTDLEGLEVVTLEGRALGAVSHLIATGANDVLVVKDAERERLIPFIVGQFVTQVDLEGGRVTVDWDPEF
ncbi:MAG: ribosome maturation factor RimM [Dokdonella sp.]|uniref:ribosome maturation factor RimM n=1 Tax=Dokdonella sp. TaxID=2291710 RepID=UPI0025C6049D|nr:ribosome maturation factor RimM [Dokdonella sp.]MBZ0221811.1 ribosome maturation factor RimM [Dokdonella sp.]MCC7254324.1 ribosome maturation factor RimM [Dokdonella sp.]